MEILIDELKSSDYYSILFDESLNETTETCKSENQICAHNLDSKFMGHATANDLLINKGDEGNHMIQVSIDGPSTNWKFF